MIADLVFNAKTIESELAEKGIVVKTPEPIHAYGRKMTILEGHADPQHEYWSKHFPEGMSHGTKVFHIISDKPGFFWGDYNFESNLKYSDYELVDRFPSFNLGSGKCFSRKEVSELYRSETHFEDWPKEMCGLVSNYGVSDSVEQVVRRFKKVVTNPDVEIVFVFTPVKKKDQPESGGWRWHKWGEYIGNHKIKHEYLFDEEGIEEVFVYQVYPVKHKFKKS